MLARSLTIRGYIIEIVLRAKKFKSFDHFLEHELSSAIDILLTK